MIPWTRYIGVQNIRTFPFNDGFFTRFNWDLSPVNIFMCSDARHIHDMPLVPPLLTGVVATSELLYIPDSHVSNFLLYS